MGRRVSASVRAVEFFRAAPLEVAEEVLALVAAELKARRPKTAKPKARTAAKAPKAPVDAEKSAEKSA